MQNFKPLKNYKKELKILSYKKLGKFYELSITDFNFSNTLCVNGSSNSP